MFEWVKEIFASCLRIVFVLYVIVISVGGGVLGKMLNWQSPKVGFMLGLPIGFALAIFSGIIIFGISATIVATSESNDRISKKLDAILRKLEKTSNNDSSSNNNDVWICKKCFATNPAGTKFCKNCGN